MKKQHTIPLLTVLIITSLALLLTVLIVGLQFRKSNGSYWEETSLARFDLCDITNWHVQLPIGDSPRYFARLIPEGSIGGFPELLMVA